MSASKKSNMRRLSVKVYITAAPSTIGYLYVSQGLDLWKDADLDKDDLDYGGSAASVSGIIYTKSSETSNQSVVSVTAAMNRGRTFVRLSWIRAPARAQKAQ